VRGRAGRLRIVVVLLFAGPAKWRCALVEHSAESSSLAAAYRDSTVRPRRHALALAISWWNGSSRHYAPTMNACGMPQVYYLLPECAGAGGLADVRPNRRGLARLPSERARWSTVLTAHGDSTSTSSRAANRTWCHSRARVRRAAAALAAFASGAGRQAS